MVQNYLFKKIFIFIERAIRLQIKNISITAKQDKKNNCHKYIEYFSTS